MKPPANDDAAATWTAGTLPPETEAAVTALEDARHELVTEEGLVANEPGAPAEESFILDHARVIRRIDCALKPFEGKYDPTIVPL